MEQPHQVLSVLVENKPGVLARVASLLARRGFNIHSLAVGPTAEPGMSKMTVVVNTPELEQVKKQLHKLINVVKITEMDPSATLERELMLVRVKAESGRRAEIMALANIFHATAVDVSAHSITFQVLGVPSKINDFVDLLRPFGLQEMVKSGRIAMAREPKGRKLKAVTG